MKNTLFFIILLFLPGFDLFSQLREGFSSPVREAYVPAELINKIEEVKTVETPDTEGSPLLFDDFKNGQVKTKKFGTLANLQLNYDLSRGEFLFEYNNSIRVMEQQDIENFSLSGQESVLYANLEDLTQRVLSGLGEVVFHEQDIFLIKKDYVNLSEPNYNPQFHTGSKKSVWNRTSITYLIMDDEPMKLPISKKQIPLIFKDKSSLIQEFVKTNRLKLKKTNDVLKILNYYRALD